MQVDAREGARKLSGGLIAVLGAAFALVMVGAFTLLDYRFQQDEHRLVKILIGMAGLGVMLSNSAIGLFALPIATPLLPWLPKLPIPGLNPLNVMVLGIFLPWALARVLKRQPVFRPSSLGAWLGVLVLICAISIVRGAAVPTGYDYNPGDSALWLFRNAMTFVIYFITLSMATGERVRRRLAWAICLGLLFESLVTIKFGQNGSGGRALGTFGQPNELGAFLSMFTVLSASLMLGVQKWYQRIFLLGATLAGVLATLMTVSRGAVIAVICGLLVVVMRSSKLLTIVLLVALGTSPIWAPADMKDRILSTQQSVEDTDETQLEGSAQIRLDTWSVLLKVVSEHPFDGVGFLGLPYVLPETGGAMGLNVKDTSHNTFLRMLAELGVFGLLLFCFILWKCWWLGERGVKAAQNRFDRQLALGLVGATLALALSCWFGDRFFSILITGNFWMLCALVDDIVLERKDEVPVAGKGAMPFGHKPVVPVAPKGVTP